MKPKKTKNVCDLLMRREILEFRNIIGIKSNWDIFKSILCSDKREFKKTIKKTSRSKIFYENDRLYLSNYKQVYSSISGHCLYNMHFLSYGEKIIDARTCETPSLGCPNEQYFVGLTDKNRLIFMHPINGTLIKAVRLPPDFKFSSIGWSEEFEVLYVKGKREILLEGNSSADATNHRTRKSKDFIFSFFGVLPLRYFGTFGVSGGVFGPLVNAFISQQCLMLAYSKNIMKFYSLKEALKKCHAKNSSNEIPTSVEVDQFLDLLPALYEIKCASGDNVEIGGFPWKCLYLAPNREHYVIENVSHSAKKLKCLVEHEELPPYIDCGNVFFHPDESGCILRLKENTISNNDVIENKGHLELVQRWETNLLNLGPTHYEIVWYTLSGRRVNNTRANRSDDGLQAILAFHYDTDLNILAVTVCADSPVPDIFIEGQWHTSSFWKGDRVIKGKLFLLNNSTGSVLREIIFDDPCDIFWDEHSIELSHEFVTQMIKYGSTNYICQVYRLTEIE